MAIVILGGLMTSTLLSLFVLPVLALAVQAAGAALFTCFSQAGSSVKAAYDTLNSMTVLVYFVPYLFMFAAAMILFIAVAGAAPNATTISFAETASA